MKRRGIIFIVSGPSGTGKSSICRKVLEEDPNLHFSVSCTTRAPRKNERDGKDYFFLSEDSFRSKVKENSFLEFAQVHGNMYGTLKEELQQYIKMGKDVLLDIDIQGVVQIQDKKLGEEFNQCIHFIFVGPPSLDELEHRLRNRGTESEEKIRRRLEGALTELNRWKFYNYLIINRTMEKAVGELQTIIAAERLKTSIMLCNQPWD